jgi:trk system potassium uptake protein TrkA
MSGAAAFGRLQVQKGSAEVIEAEALETSPLVGSSRCAAWICPRICGSERFTATERCSSPMARCDQGQGPGRHVCDARFAVRHVEQMFRVSLEFF